MPLSVYYAMYRRFSVILFIVQQYKHCENVKTTNTNKVLNLSKFAN